MSIHVYRGQQLITDTAWMVLSDGLTTTSDDIFLPLWIEPATPGSTLRLTMIGGPGSSAVDLHVSQNLGDWYDMSAHAADGSAMIVTDRRLYFRGDNVSLANWNFRFDGDVNVGGNLYSLINSTAYASMTELGAEVSFSRLFEYESDWMFGGVTRRNGYVISSARLILPGDNIGINAYHRLFYGQKNMTHGPASIAATILGQGACYEMFSGCSSMTAAPTMTAISVAEEACAMMFCGCTSMTQPITSMNVQQPGAFAFLQMYKDCRALTTPMLLTQQPTIVSEGTCKEMYMNCHSLPYGMQATFNASQGFIPPQAFCGIYKGCKNLLHDRALYGCDSVDYRAFSEAYAGCVALQDSPTLAIPHDTIELTAFKGMFNQCLSLTTIFVKLNDNLTLSASDFSRLKNSFFEEQHGGLYHAPSGSVINYTPSYGLTVAGATVELHELIVRDASGWTTTEYVAMAAKAAATSVEQKKNNSFWFIIKWIKKLINKILNHEQS